MQALACVPPRSLVALIWVVNCCVPTSPAFAQFWTTGYYPFYQAVRQALATPGPLTIQFAYPAIQLSFMSAPLGLYRILWSNNLTANAWNTLTNNVPGTNGMVVLTDPMETRANASRFYRVQTPP